MRTTPTPTFLCNAGFIDGQLFVTDAVRNLELLRMRDSLNSQRSALATIRREVKNLDDALFTSTIAPTINQLSEQLSACIVAYRCTLALYN